MPKNSNIPPHSDGPLRPKSVHFCNLISKMVVLVLSRRYCDNCVVIENTAAVIALNAITGLKWFALGICDVDMKFTCKDLTKVDSA
jgi:hypothetical protein